MIDPHSYNISIRRGEFGEETCFEARIKEFSDLTEYGDSFQEAYDLAIEAIESTAEIFADKGRDMPKPHEGQYDFSGRVTLRIPKSLHRMLANAAEDEGVSLNQYITSILSHFSGFSAGKGGQADWQAVSAPGKEKGRQHLQVVGVDYGSDDNSSWRKTG